MGYGLRSQVRVVDRLHAAQAKAGLEEAQDLVAGFFAVGRDVQRVWRYAAAVDCVSRAAYRILNIYAERTNSRSG